MTNYRSDRQTNLEIDLNEISVASRDYVIKPLIGEGNDPYEEQKEVCISNKLRWQEQVTVHYLISPLENSIQEDCAVSHCSVKKNLEDINSRASNETVTDFICLENAHDNFTVSDLYKLKLSHPKSFIIILFSSFPFIRMPYNLIVKN